MYGQTSLLTSRARATEGEQLPTLTRRHTGLVAAALVWALAGCTSITPTASEPSGAPSAAATVDLAVPPTSGPLATPTPPRAPKPSKQPKTAAPSTGPSKANLVITEFVAITDPVAAGGKAQARVTIKNEGTADAGSFDLAHGFSADDGSSVGGTVPQPVDGLAAGDSVQLTVDISLDTAGAYTFTATADVNKAVDESNEGDNVATLKVTVVDLVNLAWPEDQFTMVREANGSYDINFRVLNSGTVSSNTDFSIGLAWSSDGHSGTFPTMPCCGQILVAGSFSDAFSVPGFAFPEPGTYTVTATLDLDNVIPESDETDNQTTLDVTVPDPST